MSVRNIKVKSRQPQRVAADATRQLVVVEGPVVARLNLRTKDGSMSHHFHDASNTCEQEKYIYG
jgi:hypothetical protein